MFEELKERLEAAADAAHEEYCDAVKVLFCLLHVKMSFVLGVLVHFSIDYGMWVHNKGSEAVGVVLPALWSFPPATPPPPPPKIKFRMRKRTMILMSCLSRKVTSHQGTPCTYPSPPPSGKRYSMDARSTVQRREMPVLHVTPCDHPAPKKTAKIVGEHAACLCSSRFFSPRSVGLLNAPPPEEKNNATPSPNMSCLSYICRVVFVYSSHRFQDAKPANEYADQAVSLMDEAERLYEDLDGLGTGVKDR